MITGTIIYVTAGVVGIITAINALINYKRAEVKDRPKMLLAYLLMLFVAAVTFGIKTLFF